MSSAKLDMNGMSQAHHTKLNSTQDGMAWDPVLNAEAHRTVLSQGSPFGPGRNLLGPRTQPPIANYLPLGFGLAIGRLATEA